MSDLHRLIIDALTADFEAICADDTSRDPVDMPQLDQALSTI